MANNRLYLSCTRCNEYLYLGKHFGQPYGLSASMDDISDFLSDHFWCANHVEKPEYTVALVEEGLWESMTGVELPDNAINWKEKYSDNANP